MLETRPTINRGKDAVEPCPKPKWCVPNPIENQAHAEYRDNDDCGDAAQDDQGRAFEDFGHKVQKGDGENGDRPQEENQRGREK